MTSRSRRLWAGYGRSIRPAINHWPASTSPEWTGEVNRTADYQTHIDEGRLPERIRSVERALANREDASATKDRLRFTGPNVRQGVADQTGDDADHEPGQHIPCDVPRWTENDDAHDHQKARWSRRDWREPAGSHGGATTTATFG